MGMTQQPPAELAHLQQLLEAALREADRCDQAVAAHVATAIARLEELMRLPQSKAR
jgi:hypothetical protein